MPSIQPFSAAQGNVQAAIANAAARTDTDFDYMLAQARVESSLNPNARARTSSAAGLYQFTNQTWLATLNRHGAAHGLGWAADAITMNDGQASVADPALRAAIMDLRFNPEVASLMAGEFAGDNAEFLEGALGRPVDSTELYLAHFLGAEGARRFISAHDADPSQSAAALFPQAANANRSIFFEGGSARSLGEVRAHFTARLSESGAIPDASGAWAAAAGGNPYSGNYGGGFLPVAANAAAPAAAPARRPSMSEVLASALGPFEAATGTAAPAHVARAYSQLSRFGL